MRSAPIIFIHYGDSYYLPSTLRSVLTSNPGQRIILLGDDENRKYSEWGIEHHNLDDFSKGPEIERFESVFRLIQGAKHSYNKARGTDYWAKFVFRRWFVMLNFLKFANIGPFWTFDSDTLILAPLHRRQNRFISLDCTEQCQGCCMNGWISGPQIVSRYVNKMNDLFEDEAYLAEQEEYHRVSAPGAAYNEMTAFMTFREREDIHTKRLSSVIEDESFDDALAFTSGYEAHKKKIGGRLEIKRLWTNGSQVFARSLEEDCPVRLITCNMSWMPKYFCERISSYASPLEDLPHPEAFTGLKPISIAEPLELMLRRHFDNLRRRLPF